MKKAWKYILAVVVVVVGGYLVGWSFYQNRFAANTQYASINIGNLSLKQAEKKIQQEISNRIINIKDQDQAIAAVKLGDLNPVIGYKDALEKMYKKRDPLAWPMSLVSNAKAEQKTEDLIEFDASALKSVLEEQGVNNEGRTGATPDTIEYAEDKGYFIQEGSNGTAINYESLKDAIITTVEEDKTTVDLSDAYQTSHDVTDEAKLDTEFKKIDKVQSVKITYQLAGDEITIPKEKIASWISIGDDDEITVDNDALQTYVDELNEKYATFGKTREFQSTYQGTVEVPPGILGWMVDGEFEVPRLAEDILAGNDVTRKPEIYSTGVNGGEADEIGDTYVEVDLTNQTMFLYVDGEQILSTDVVSGQPNSITGQQTETIPGANAVNEMLIDTSLKGYNPVYKVDYSVPVTYWIRFDDNAQGIHDAPWQSAFGGDVLNYSGSLGCINTPYWAVETIYQYVQIGTPVIVFY